VDVCNRIFEVFVTLNLITQTCMAMKFSRGDCCISGMSLLTLKGSKVLQILMDLNGFCLNATWTSESEVFFYPRWTPKGVFPLLFPSSL
jgi:hypothetical protein